MKKGLNVSVFISSICLALAGIFLLVSCSKIQRENDRQEMMEQKEKKKMDEEARLKFKELLGIDVPDGITVKRYYHDENSGHSSIDMEFDENNYDNVFRRLEEGPVKRNPLIFQKEDIYSKDNPIVFSYDDDDVFKRFPSRLGWFQEGKSQMDFIVGYMLYATGQNGYTTRYICWILVRDTTDGLYHLMVDG